MTCRHWENVGISQKDIFDHFESTFLAKGEAYLHIIDDMSATIKAARDMVQTFKVELPSQLAASWVIAYMVESVENEI